MKIRPVSQRMFLCAVILTLTVVGSPLRMSASGDDGKGFDHVFIIMMENTGYDTLIGNPNAPFINFAASTSGLAANYYGVAHPSQPNCIGANSGALNGVVDDNDITIDDRRPTGVEGKDLESVHAVVLFVRHPARPFLRKPVVRAQAQSVYHV